jgi:hypothetical protein
MSIAHLVPAPAPAPAPAEPAAVVGLVAEAGELLARVGEARVEVLEDAALAGLVAGLARLESRVQSVRLAVAAEAAGGGWPSRPRRPGPMPGWPG